MPGNVKPKLDNKREMENIHHIVYCCYGKRRFFGILNDIEGVSNRMLSKELKELEINQLVKRTVLDTQPITVQYELTEHGNTLQTIISNLTDWGIVHRKKIVGK